MFQVGNENNTGQKQVRTWDYEHLKSRAMLAGNLNCLAAVSK
jgi:hypothetical protein